MKRLGIVVPFRDRWEHYYEFLGAISYFLEDHDYEYRIIVVEQDNAKPFNRGMLCNIGFLQAKKLKCDYVVFHDIDIVPHYIDYTYSEVPMHLASKKVPFKSYFGGVTLFSMEVFEKINGFSNFYWGWGFEDDDLRYRCIENGIQFESNLNSNITPTEKTLVFNGINSYTKVPNIITYIRDFSIELDLTLDNLEYNKDKAIDKFTIFEIENKFIFNLSFTSFKRFVLQFFDTRGTYYQIYTPLISKNINNVKVNYNAKEKTITLICNDEFSETVQLEYRLYNYKKAEFINIGVNNQMNEYFKGSIERLKVKNSDNISKLYYNSTEVKEYKWKDLTKQGFDAKLYNIVHSTYKSPLNYDGFIPFRRRSKYRTLKHSNNGFENGRWLDDLTRWNQLRYNNEVIKGAYKNIEDGLSTCIYKVHSKKTDKKITHLTVGIN